MNAHVPLFAIIVEVSILSFCSFTEECRQNNKNGEQWKKEKNKDIFQRLIWRNISFSCNKSGKLSFKCEIHLIHVFLKLC